MTPPSTSAASRLPVIVVGAGPVGLTATLDLMFRGIGDVILLDEGDGPAVGSRAICWSRRSLEILSRLGVGRQLVGQGFTWQTGRVYRPADIDAQRNGAVAAGASGWMMWDPSNRYTRGGFGARP